MRKLSFIVALLMLLSTFVFVPVNAENINAENSLKSEEIEAAMQKINDNRNNNLSYYNYINSHQQINAESEFATKKPFNIKNGEITAYEGKQDVAVINEGGSVSYTVNSPESALYVISIDYFPIEGKNRDMEISLSINGEVPFDGASNMTLRRCFTDETKEFEFDFNGNQLQPIQTEVFRWMSEVFSDNETFNGCQYRFYLEKGEHTIELKSNRESIAVSSLHFSGEKQPLSNSQLIQFYQNNGFKNTTGHFQIYEAEHPFEKSNITLLPTFDRSSPKTQPYSTDVVLLNTIGQESWARPGQWISYEVDAPESGLYELGIKFKQSALIGMSTCRNIYVNDEIISESFKGVQFPYKASWQYKEITESNGDICKIYLEKGKNTIKFEVTLGNRAEILTEVDQINVEMNELYRKIIMVTGVSPDPNRDYYLERQIPELLEKLDSISKRLGELADKFDELNEVKSSQSEDLRRVSEQLLSFVKNPATIAVRMPNFSDNITSISAWIMNLNYQPLEMDYIVIKSSDMDNPKYKANFFEQLIHEFFLFIGSFFNDYNNFESQGGTGEKVKVWLNSGRTQAQIIRNLIDRDFTPKTGITVDLSVVNMSGPDASATTVAAVLADTGPDVALMIPRNQPVNFAWRGALTELSQFDTYDEVMSRFHPEATVPYTFKDGVYAVPCTETFYMMFYRTDIFDELDVEPPRTWNELYSLTAILQRQNMTIGIPYMNISASLDGLGTKDIFATILKQNGGSLYNENHTATALDTQQAFNSFKQWTEFYTLYGYDTEYNFNTRFRTGEMPIGIAPYEMYNTFSIAAPEIRNQWTMTTLPGTIQDDGSVDYSVASTGMANIMFNDVEYPEASWKFLDWFSTVDIQQKFGMDIENIFGPAARYPTANLEAFEMLPWSLSEIKLIDEQRKTLFRLPEIPGDYFVTRCLDNAFRDVVFTGKNAREIFDRQNKIINQEIERKYNEVEKINKQ